MNIIRVCCQRILCYKQSILMYIKFLSHPHTRIPKYIMVSIYIYIYIYAVIQQARGGGVKSMFVHHEIVCEEKSK